MTDLSSLTADQLAEKVRLHVVVLMHTHRLGREDDAHTACEALAELVRRLNTTQTALAVAQKELRTRGASTMNPPAIRPNPKP